MAENGELETLLYDLRNKLGKLPSVLENNTLQENWNASYDSGSQWSHCAVVPIVMLYQGLAGAKPLTPGGKKYRIWPHPEDLSLVDIDIQTLTGAIGFKCEGLKGDRIISLDVPQGTEVELWLDAREKIDLPMIEKLKNGITKYSLKGSSKIMLKLKYT